MDTFWHNGGADLVAGLATLVIMVSVALWLKKYRLPGFVREVLLEERREKAEALAAASKQLYEAVANLPQNVWLYKDDITRLTRVAMNEGEVTIEQIKLQQPLPLPPGHSLRGGLISFPSEGGAMLKWIVGYITDEAGMLPMAPSEFMLPEANTDPEYFEMRVLRLQGLRPLI